MTVRTTLLVVGALALGACSRGSDKPQAPAKPATLAPAPRGPDHFVLRVPRAGGLARVYAYPRLDTIVWSAASAPPPDHVLAFDEEAGSISYVDAKGAPARIDFRQGTATPVTKTKLIGLQSWDGSNIYGIGEKGSVDRYGPSGPWSWMGRLPARAVFPQPDGTLLVLAQHLDGSVVWRLRPPSQRIVDSVRLSKVNHTLRTQVGDQLYLASGRELTGVRTRTMKPTTSVHFDDEIEIIEATPSGDRVFIVTRGSTAVHIVDRYRDALSGEIPVGKHIADVRIDPLGRYMLAHPEATDSVIVIALGTNRVIGAIATTWRDDLPFVAPDGGVVVTQGPDVSVIDGETLRPKVRVNGGAADFWYAFQWTGFRPRDASLDKPVNFSSPGDTLRTVTDSTAPKKPDSASAPVALPPPAAAPAPRDTARRTTGWTVSFAALLAQDKARELAAQIHVGGETARVVSAVRDGSTIYRVVLGPYATADEADRVCKDSKQSSCWKYQGGP